MADRPETIGRYRISGELGKGSMGVVYEARGADGPPVAVKVFQPDQQLAPEELRVLRERFAREGQTLAQISHRNVVRVFDSGSDAAQQPPLEYIVMEKLEGYNLKELLQLGTRFTLAETFDITLQLLAGLSACHKAGLIHRDVKPANLVRAPNGDVKLTDFGIARVVTDATLARSGTVVGTPNYMSPEQIRGEDVGPASDVFSAGTLMYELLTAKKPFEGPDMTAIMYNVTHIRPPSPRFYNGAMPPELDEIVFRSLAKDPAQRYASADEFAGAIRSLEESLHYREGTAEILSSLPSSPDLQADDGAAALSAGAAAAARGAAASGTAQATAAVGSMGIGAAAFAQPKAGAVFCVDCGTENPDSHEFCTACMRPLLKRSNVHQLASAQARAMNRNNRADYLFLTCLSILMVGTLLGILWLLFRKSF